MSSQTTSLLAVRFILSSISPGIILDYRDILMKEGNQDSTFEGEPHFPRFNAMLLGWEDINIRSFLPGIVGYICRLAAKNDTE